MNDRRRQAHGWHAALSEKLTDLRAPRGVVAFAFLPRAWWWCRHPRVVVLYENVKRLTHRLAYGEPARLVDVNARRTGRRAALAGPHRPAPTPTRPTPTAARHRVIRRVFAAQRSRFRCGVCVWRIERAGGGPRRPRPPLAPRDGSIGHAPTGGNARAEGRASLESATTWPATRPRV